MRSGEVVHVRRACLRAAVVGRQGRRPNPAPEETCMSTPIALDLETPVRDGITTFTTFVPKLIGFLVILLVGYFVAKIISKLIDKGLEKAGFDRAVERGGIKKALAKSSYDASDIEI